jgi:hypothetical protein
LIVGPPPNPRGRHRTFRRRTDGDIRSSEANFSIHRQPSVLHPQSSPSFVHAVTIRTSPSPPASSCPRHLGPIRHRWSSQLPGSKATRGARSLRFRRFISPT